MFLFVGGGIIMKIRPEINYTGIKSNESAALNISQNNKNINAKVSQNSITKIQRD
jgi:hypothetical protein